MSDARDALENALIEPGADDPRVVGGDVLRFRVRGGTYDEVAVELGLYFIFLTVLGLGLLDQVRGKPKKLNNWLLYRKVAIFRKDQRNSASVSKYLGVILRFYMVMPFFALVGWTALVLYDNVKEGLSVLSAICILVLGLAAMLFGYTVLRVKWSNYRFKRANLIALLVVLVLISLYQLAITFGYDSEEEKFLAYSAVFLNINVIVMSILIFLSKYKDAKGINHIITKFFPETGEALDRDRDDDMIAEIESQRKDPGWTQSYEDLLDLITISKVSGEKFDSVSGGGLLQRFKSLKKSAQWGVQLGMLAGALVVLAAYAVVIAWLDGGNKLGVITACSVALSDLFNFLLYNSSMVDTPTGLTFLLILNRALMVALGANHWIYGYMILYLMYGLVFAYQVARNRFPFEGDVVLRSAKIETFLKAGKDKKGARAMLKQGFRNPEILLTILTLFYMGLLALVSFVEFEGVELHPFVIFGYTLEYWQCGLATVYMVISVFFMLALARIYVRKATRADIFGQAAGGCCGRSSLVSTLGVYMFLNLVVVELWAGCAWWVTEDPFWFLYGGLAALALLYFARGYVYFVLNEYDYFQDVKKLNKTIDRHNKKIDEMEKKKSEIQQQLLDGTLVLPKLEENRPQAPRRRSDKQVAPAKPIAGPSLPGQLPSRVTPHDETGLSNLNGSGLGHGGTEEDEGRKPRGQQDAEELEGLAAMRELIAQEQERKRTEIHDRQRQLAGDAKLARKEEEERRAMEEQMRLEREEEQRGRQEARRVTRRRTDALGLKHRALEAARRREEALKPSVGGDNPVTQTYSGQMQAGPPPSPGGVYEDEELYDGGDGEATQAALNPDEVYDSMPGGPAPSLPGAPAQQVYDPTSTYIDMDAAEERGQQRKIASTRLRRVKDWRLRHSSWMAALCAGALRPNDKRLLSSLSLSSAFTIGLMATLTNDMADFVGVIICLPFVYFAVCLLVASTVLRQSRTFTCKELLWWFVVNVLYVGCGIAYFILDYEADSFTYDLDQRSEAQVQASIFVFLYILTMPTLAHALVLVLRLVDRGTEDFDIKFKAFTVAFFFGLLLMVASTFIFVHWIDGLVLLGILAAIVYSLAQICIYIQNGYYLKPIWQIINSILVVCCVGFASVYAVASSEISTYEGVSYSVAALLFFLWTYALFQFGRDIFESTRRPLYFSATLFPIYKYNPQKSDVEEHYGPTIAWVIGLVLLLFWAFLTNYQITPEWYGVVATIAVELIFLLSILNMRQITLDSFDNASEFITSETAKKAWIETKASYIKAKGAFSRQSLLTYRRAWVNRYFIRNLLAIMRNEQFQCNTAMTPEVEAEVAVMRGIQPMEFYQSKIEEFIPTEIYDLNDIHDVAHNAHIWDVTVHETYLDELQQVVQFIMISVQNSLLLQQQRQKDFIRFLNGKKPMLHALGISIQVPTKGTIDQRWEEIENQIEELKPKERKVFEQLRLLYDKEQKARKNVSKESEEKERQKNDRRDQQGEEMRKKKEQRLAELEQQTQVSTGQVDINMDIDNMPDCRLKYQIIVKRAKEKGEKFTDAQFPAGPESIGEEVSAELGGDCEWPRISEYEGSDGAYMIFQDGVDVNDVEQGSLGDCYFLSALVVLGNETTREKFIFIEADDEWQKCGAFCVKFYDQGREDIVIVDDHMPMMGGDWIFVTTRTRTELWPAILEKAYAKKYGSYSTIAGGLLDIALSELTNGIPETLKKDDNENLQKLWDKVTEAKNEGAFLGAGSPSHPDGDRATSDDGIVQGHAYSVLRLVEVDGAKLIQLRNPWGSGEWTGDWSDDSELWTTRMKNVLNYDVFEDDGVFWMDFSDFMEEFETIYVCRNYCNQKEWKSLLVEDAWEGSYAEGLPSKKNRKAKMEKNPQFGITVHKAGRGYLVMRLKEKENSYTSKQAGYLNLQANDGEIIDYSNMKKKEIAKSGPRHVPLQPVEVHFPAHLDYPYTFTAIIANPKKGEEGHGHFSLQVFSKDHEMAVEKLN